MSKCVGSHTLVAMMTSGAYDDDITITILLATIIKYKESKIGFDDSDNVTTNQYLQWLDICSTCDPG